MRGSKIGFGVMLLVVSCNGLGNIYEGTEPSGTPCSTVADCKPVEGEPALAECPRIPSCVAGLCRYDDTPYGTPLSTQTPGDCKERVCNGEGGVAEPVDYDDIDDGNPCTEIVCNDDEPMKTLLNGVEFDCYGGPPLTINIGACHGGKGICMNGMQSDDCIGDVVPRDEECKPGDIIDEDCDGQVNEEGEGCECLPGSTIPCYDGPLGTEGVGACKAGLRKCLSDGTGYELGCTGEVTPIEETCKDPSDEDCDGQTNESGTDCNCGDGFIEDGEECDDDNGANDDACIACKRVVKQVVAGGNHVCALHGDVELKNGELKCWGYGLYGQLGIGTSNLGDDPNTKPASLSPILTNVKSVVAGGNHTCALFENGSLSCWGSGTYGQLGLGDSTNRGEIPDEIKALPAIDLGGETIASVVAGGYHTCVLTDGGRVKCWGRNDFGQLGLGNKVHRGDNAGEMGNALPAVQLGFGVKAIAIAAGAAHTCALLEGGGIKCWGANSRGQLGQGDVNNRGDDANEMGDKLPLIALGDGGAATAIAAGGDHSCALLSSGQVKCWGANANGELGLGDNDDRGSSPTDMGDNLLKVELGAPPGVAISAITAGAFHFCALFENGQAKCWGYNTYGQLGLGTTNTHGLSLDTMGTNLPFVNFGDKRVMTMTAGASHTCAILRDGFLRCWGYNAYGQLGLGDTESRGDNETLEAFEPVRPW